MKKIHFILLLPLLIILKISCDATNPTPVYNLTTDVSPSDGGTITPESGEYEEEETVELDAEPAEGYIFVRWEGDHSGSINPAYITFNSDKNVTAVFALKEYSLEIQTEGEGSVREEIVEEAEKTDYEHGTTVQLTAEPEEGWEFIEWKGDLSGSENPETIHVEEEKNVTAVFAMKEYTMDLQIEGDGNVSVDPDKSSYEHGENITFTAEASEGWRFLEWEGDLSGEDEEVTIEGIDENKEITAVFTTIEGALWTMGYNGNGQLGDGSTTSQEEPVRQFYEVDDVTAGAFHSLYIRDDATLWAMGYNGNGQLGNGSTSDQHVPIEIDSDVSMISAGRQHSLFVKNDGTLWAMGENQYGQLGDRSTSDRHQPEQVQVDSGMEVVAISAGYNHSLFITSDGSLWGMGRNHVGQLGDSTVTEQATATPVLLAENVSSIVAGDNYSLFIDEDNSLYGMGSASGGKLGIGGSDQNPPGNQWEPQLIEDDVQAITAGRHSLFIKSDGSLWAMGYNESGQLGDGTNSNRYTPVEIAENVSDIAAGNEHSLYITADDELWSMGRNAEGQLGDGSGSSQSSPVQIDTNVSKIATGFRHSLYLQD